MPLTPEMFMFDPIVPELKVYNPIHYKKVPILDQGYVQFIEHWGRDERIIEAARMSTDKGFNDWGPLNCEKCSGTGQVELHVTGNMIGRECSECKGKGTLQGDEKLLRYLYEHKHATPFEFAGMVIEVQLPIMAIREWHRHRTQGYAEMSARYVPLPDFNYYPTPERCLMVNAQNRQAGAVKGSDELTHESVLEGLAELERAYHFAEQTYQSLLKRGFPKELARLPVPVGRYTRMRATTSLRCWLMFLTLRMDEAAQWEIRQFANQVGVLIQQLFPRTYELFASRA